MQRYFINEANINDKIITIDESDSHHIRTVMRMKIGEEVICTINKLVTYQAQIISLEKKVKLQITKEIIVAEDLKVNISVAQGLINREKTEEVIKRLCELGVKDYYPILMTRSKYSLEQTKYSRFNKIIKESCEQAQRNSLLEISNPLAFADLQALGANYEHKFFANPEAKTSLKTYLKDKKLTDVLFVVGPEGGFTDLEVEKLQKWAYQEVNLGKLILRTQTAPLYIASVLACLEGNQDAD